MVVSSYLINQSHYVLLYQTWLLLWKPRLLPCRKLLQPCLLQWMIIRSNKDMTICTYKYVLHHNPCLLTPHWVRCPKCHFERSNLFNRITEDLKMKGDSQFLTKGEGSSAHTDLAHLRTQVKSLICAHRFGSSAHTTCFWGLICTHTRGFGFYISAKERTASVQHTLHMSTPVM